MRLGLTRVTEILYVAACVALVIGELGGNQRLAGVGWLGPLVLITWGVLSARRHPEDLEDARRQAQRSRQ